MAYTITEMYTNIVSQLKLFIVIYLSATEAKQEDKNNDILRLCVIIRSKRSLHPVWYTTAEKLSEN